MEGKKVYHKIARAAQRGSIIHPWIVKIEKPEVTFDDLSDTEGHDTLDAALCCAIFEIPKGELCGTLTLKSRELRSQGHFLTGRQALSWCTRSSPWTRSAARSTTSPTCSSDDQAPRFFNLWQHTVQGLTEKQPDGNVMTLLKAQLENAPALKLDMAHFNRLPKGDPERTYVRLPHDLPQALRGHRQEEAGQGEDAHHAVWRTTSYSPGRPRRGGARLATLTCASRSRTPGAAASETGAGSPTPPEARPRRRRRRPSPQPSQRLRLRPDRGPSTTPSNWLPARRSRATHSPTEDAASETGATNPHSADPANVAMHVPAFDVTDNSDFEITTSEEDEEDVHGILYHQGIFMNTDNDSDEEKHDTGRLHVEPHTDHLVQEFDMALIASETFPVRHRVSQWGIETASANHLIGRSKINNEDAHFLQKMDRPKRLATANGIITMDQTFRRPRGKPQPDGGSHRDDDLPGRPERWEACDGARLLLRLAGPPQADAHQPWPDRHARAGQLGPRPPAEERVRHPGQPEFCAGTSGGARFREHPRPSDSDAPAG